MTRLNELINELCPDGVEYKTLGETVGVNRGKRLVKKQLSDNGAYEVYHGSKESILGRYDQYNAPANTTIVVNTGGIGGVKFLEKPFWCSDGSFWLGKSSEINSKYLYYCLSGYEDYFYSQKRVGGVPTIDRSVVENFKIPVPPLPVQEEIVRILDKFTSLEAELEAELEARRVQYEYYRDELLTRETKVQIKTLGEVAKIKNGKDYKHLSEGKYPVYGSGGIMTYVNDFCYDKPSVLIPRKGSINNLFYVDEPFWNVDTVFYTEINEKIITPKYFYYLLKKEHLEKLNTAGGVPSLTQAVLNKVILSIPPIEVQRRIVNVLDNFDAICSDLKIGLPAEIDARKKQYEYYRDLLLTFAERGNTILTEQNRTEQNRTEQNRTEQMR